MLREGRKRTTEEVEGRNEEKWEREERNEEQVGGGEGIETGEVD